MAGPAVSASLIPGKPGFEQAILQTDATVAEEAVQFVRLQVSLP